MRRMPRLFTAVVAMMTAVLASPRANTTYADTFEFLPISCRVLQSGPIPPLSVIRFHVTPGGPLGAWQSTGLIVPPSGPPSSFFQNGSASCGLPTGISGVQLNLTIVSPDRVGHVVLWPSGETFPLISQMNTFPNITLGEEITVKIGGGPYDLDLFMVAGAQSVIVDLTGLLNP